MAEGKILSHLYFQLLLAHIWPVLLASAILLKLAGKRLRAWRWFVPLVCAATLSMRLGDLSPSEYLRGLTGDLSITSVLLLGAVAWELFTGRQLISVRDRWGVFACIALAGLSLYPMTLGLGAFDPYELGYRPLALLAALLALAVCGYLRGNLAAFLIPIVVLAWSAGAMESTNLWDYMVDPLVFLYAVGWLVAASIRWIRRDKTSPGALSAVD